MFNDDSQETISLRQILGVVRRNSGRIFLAVLLSTALALFAANYLPQRYKSKAVLSIQSGYFQHPLVSDLISEVRDPGELSAQRLSLLRLALNDQFLDELGERYHIYKQPASSGLSVLDRELLLKRIEYFSVSPTTFQISIITGSPQSAFAMTKDVLSQMTFTLIERRFQNLMQARGAILKQAKLLGSTLNNNGTNSPQLETLQAQLATMESNLSALRRHFTEQHPQVVSVKNRAVALKNQIEHMPVEMTKAADDYTKVFLNPASLASTQEIFNDLLKKLSHLNVVLEMERDRQNVSYLSVIEQPTIPIKPFSPDRLQFVLFGALGGFLLGGISAVFRELKRASILSPDQVSLAFDLKLLGELPPFEKEGRILFLEPPQKRIAALPLSARGS